MPNTGNFMLSTKWYNRAKFVVQIFLPALASLYFGLSAIWGLPNAEQVMGTLAVIGTFLGVTLGVSSRSYDNSDAKYDGVVVVDPNDPDKDNVSLETFGDPRDILEEKNELRLKLIPPSES